MRDIDDDIRDSLERLTDPHGTTPGTDALWSDLMDRRRKRRNRNRTLAALPVLLVAVLAVGLFVTQGSDDARSFVAADGAEVPSSDDLDGSWRIAATVNNGERERATGTANLRFDGDQVQGSDGCDNPIDTTLENGVIVGPSVRTQVGCAGDAATKEADLFWEALGNPVEVRGGELWLVNDRDDGLIFERIGSTDGDSAMRHDPSPSGGVDGPVLYGPEQDGMEQALVGGRLVHDGDCLYLAQAAPNVRDNGPEVVVWPNGTTWQNDPEGVTLSDGTFVPVGAEITASGGIHDIDRLVERGHHSDVAERARACAFENIDTVMYVQGEVKMNPGEPEAGNGSLSFEPFTMRYRTTGDTGTEFMWTLDYTSVEEWSMELVSTTTSASAYEVGATETFKDGKHTITFGPSESAHVEEEELDEPLAPLQVLSRGPIRTFDTLYGQPARPAVHEGRDGYETTETVDCPHGNTDEVDWCGNPGGQVKLTTFYEFNSDGVPVLAHSYIEGTNPLVWRLEVLDYERKS